MTIFDPLDDLMHRLAAISAAGARAGADETPQQRAAREAQAIGGRFWGEQARSELRRNESYRRKVADRDRLAGG